MEIREKKTKRGSLIFEGIAEITIVRTFQWIEQWRLSTRRTILSR